MSAKRKIEVFTTGCPSCEEVVETINTLACDHCEVTVYDVVTSCRSEECATKVNEYGITRFPAVAINGELLSCCH